MARAFRNKSASAHQFAMVPRADIPRSSFVMEKTYKTTFDAGFLVPFYVMPYMPGDTLSCDATLFARMTTPLFPVMDNLHLETFFFDCPYRILWDNFVKFMGEQENPDDSIDFTIPQVRGDEGVLLQQGYADNSLGDYFGLPTGSYIGAPGWEHSALPFRAYFTIWNQWFRDQNLQDSIVVSKGDGPDTFYNGPPLRRGKRHDYFTSALPWTQKGGVSVQIPLGTSAPVRGLAIASTADAPGVTGGVDRETGGVDIPAGRAGWPVFDHTAGQENSNLDVFEDPDNPTYPLIWADLSEAVGATINAQRQAFAIQKLLERDARGGTRYTEIIRAHFGVVSPDARLQRPEYLGGGYTPVNIHTVAKTGTGEFAATPLGTLAGVGTALGRGHGFTKSFTEHGVVIGLVCVRADITYQQGLARWWSDKTRYDFPFPVFSGLGEQAILNKEIYLDGSAADSEAFGYQERYGHWRYDPSQITGKFRSDATGTLDAWHLSQEFGTRPVLNDEFIVENPPMDRVLAVGAAANGSHFYLDAFCRTRAARPLPMYAVPGLIDHF